MTGYFRSQWQKLCARALKRSAGPRRVVRLLGVETLEDRVTPVSLPPASLGAPPSGSPPLLPLLLLAPVPVPLGSGPRRRGEASLPPHATASESATVHPAIGKTSRT